MNYWLGNRKHQFQIQNLRAIELEAVADKWLCSVSERLNHLGEQLQKVEAELASRDIKDLSTPQLHSLARNLRRQMDQAAGPLPARSSCLRLATVRRGAGRGRRDLGAALPRVALVPR